MHIFTRTGSLDPDWAESFLDRTAIASEKFQIIVELSQIANNMINPNWSLTLQVTKHTMDHWIDHKSPDELEPLVEFILVRITPGGKNVRRFAVLYVRQFLCLGLWRFIKDSRMTTDNILSPNQTCCTGVLHSHNYSHILSRTHIYDTCLLLHLPLPVKIHYIPNHHNLFHQHHTQGTSRVCLRTTKPDQDRILYRWWRVESKCYPAPTASSCERNRIRDVIL